MFGNGFIETAEPLHRIFTESPEPGQSRLNAIKKSDTSLVSVQIQSELHLKFVRESSSFFQVIIYFKHLMRNQGVGFFKRFFNFTPGFKLVAGEYDEHILSLLLPTSYTP